MADWADERVRAWLRHWFGDASDNPEVYDADGPAPSIAADLRAAYERGVRDSIETLRPEYPDGVRRLRVLLDKKGGGDG